MLKAHSNTVFSAGATYWRSVYRPVAHHIYSIWLFTFSDLKTIVLPETAFGILTALSQAGIEGNDRHAAEGIAILRRAPLVVFWVWINLLPFAINNQRKPAAVAEDALNKPWRPMPSRRWNSSQAWYSMLFFYHIAVLVSWGLGGLRSSLFLVFLGYVYNECGGSDVNAWIRNLINASGYTCFGTGALELALDRQLSFNLKNLGHINTGGLETWLLVVAAVVFSTVQTQDMADQQGDQLRGRRSLPLQIGDIPARWTITTAMAFWGFFCPYFWNMGWLGYAISTPLSYAVAYRSIRFRAVESDKTTFKLWNLWMASLYCLPLIKRLAV
ncbi:UbiA prenyltransferase family [Xylariaceae sp. FL0804]|nr:UbiA prenyltransferase family [Xylariaceae sp. FL0804]